MLGEKVIEEKGKVTSTRVMESFPHTKIETSFEAQGKILGIEHRTIGTYWSIVQDSGTLYGEGNGMLMTKEGTASWKGGGTGKFLENGGVQFRGAVYYQTKAERLLRLNGLTVVFEYEVDGNGNTNSFGFEWK